MSAMLKSNYDDASVSAEEEAVDREIDRLYRKVMSGRGEESDRRLLEELIARRTRMMKIASADSLLNI